MGLIVQHEWDKSFEIRKELFCDLYVIMPNHIHAILRIEKNDSDGFNMAVDPHGRADLQQIGRADLQQIGRADLRTAVRTYQNPMVSRIVHQNRYHHLLQDLNQQQQNGSMNAVICRNRRFGNLVFMTILFVMMTNITELKDTSWRIRVNGIGSSPLYGLQTPQSSQIFLGF